MRVGNTSLHETLRLLVVLAVRDFVCSVTQLDDLEDQGLGYEVEVDEEATGRRQDVEGLIKILTEVNLFDDVANDA